MATKYGEQSKKEVKKAMHEYKEGKLKSGGKSHKKVSNPKQAIAIGLSKGARRVPRCRRRRAEPAGKLA